MSELDPSKIKDVFEIQSIILAKGEEDELERNFVFLPDLDKCGIAFTIPVYQLLAYLDKISIIKIKRNEKVT